MNTFYSILYCSIRPNIDERVSIGLFMADSNTCYFSFSAEKLHAVKQLISEEAFGLMRTSLKSLSKISAECRDDNFIQSHRGHNILRESYFNYLSNYSNNLITYSPPSNLDMELSQVVFDKLFVKFVHSLTPSVKEPVKPVERAKRILQSSISGHVNFDVELKKDDVPGLVVPAKVWFIGKNEVEVTGEAKDFSGPLHLLQPQINAHLFLIEKIKDTKNGRNGHFFFVGDEPSKNLPDNHKLWKALRDDRTLDLVPTNELQRIEEYMQFHGVEPLFQLS